MVRRGPTLKTLASNLKSIGEKATSKEAPKNADQLRKWAMDNPELASKLLLVIEEGWLEYLIQDSANMEEKPFSGSQNCMSSLPSWFYQQIMESEQVVALLPGLFKSRANYTQLKKKNKDFFKRVFFVLTCYDPKQAVAKGSLPSALLQEAIARIKVVNKTSSRLQHMQCDEDMEVDWQQSGSFKVLPQGEAGVDGFVEVMHQPSGAKVTLGQKWSEGEWKLKDPWSEHTCKLADEDNEISFKKRFSEKLFAYRQQEIQVPKVVPKLVKQGGGDSSASSARSGGEASASGAVGAAVAPSGGVPKQEVPKRKIDALDEESEDEGEEEKK